MTVLEMLATKKKPATPPTDTAVALPMAVAPHEDACGDGCGCGDHGGEGGCCGG